MRFSRFTRYIVILHSPIRILIICQTGWGTRAGIGDPTAATAAADKGDTEKKEEVQTTTYPQTQELYQQPPVEMQTGYAR